MQHKTQGRNPSEARGNRRPWTDAGRLQRIETERIRRQLQTSEEHVRKTEIGWLRCPQRKCHSVHSSNLQVNDICYWTYQGDLGIAIPDLNLHSDVRYQSFSFFIMPSRWQFQDLVWPHLFGEYKPFLRLLFLGAQMIQTRVITVVYLNIFIFFSLFFSFPSFFSFPLWGSIIRRSLRGFISSSFRDVASREELVFDLISRW